MTMTATYRPATLPVLNTETLTTLLLAGAAATVAFDMFGQALAPLAGYAKLAPAPLAGSVVKVIVGEPIKHAGSLIHYLTGLIFYALGWMFIARPLAKTLTPSLPWPVVAVIYGVGLWIFALYVMAHLVAGNAPFLGWGGITWVALWGHILYAVVVAWVAEARRG
ncbi:MAG: hypothetical protein AAF401_01740 [Pseudomonadota bacterium]